MITHNNGWRFGVAAVALVAFAVLTAQVVAGGWATGADRSTLDWIVGNRTAVLDRIAMTLSVIGAPGCIVLYAVVIAAVLWRWRGSRMPAVVLGCTLLAAGVASSGTKAVVDRARPDPSLHLVSAQNAAFPSGHVAWTTAFVVALVALCGPTFRVIAAITALVAVVIVAISRIYLGVHQLTDVIGGALLGGAVALSVCTAVQVVSDRQGARTDGTERGSRLAGHGSEPPGADR